MAVEVAYSSFCDMLKVDRFAQLSLPALEIDLRAFTPEGFEPEAVRAAVLHDIRTKTWLWPKPPVEPAYQPQPTPTILGRAAPTDLPRSRLPEEVVTISDRWVLIKEFPSGDIAVKVVKYDPDLVSMVKTSPRRTTPGTRQSGRLGTCRGGGPRQSARN